MVRFDFGRAAPLYLAWLGLLGASLLVALSEILPFRLSFVRPDNLFMFLTLLQVFFMVLVLPLFISELLTGAGLLFQVGVLLVTALPLGLACWNVSNLDLVALLRGMALVGGVGAFVGGVHFLARVRGWRIEPWYYLGAFVVSAAFPFMAFLSVEMDGGGNLAFLAAVSPFWGGVHVEGNGALVQAAVFGAPGLAICLAFRKGLDASALRR